MTIPTSSRHRTSFSPSSPSRGVVMRMRTTTSTTTTPPPVSPHQVSPSSSRNHYDPQQTPSNNLSTSLTTKSGRFDNHNHNHSNLNNSSLSVGSTASCDSFVQVDCCLTSSPFYTANNNNNSIHNDNHNNHNRNYSNDESFADPYLPTVSSLMKRRRQRQQQQPQRKEVEARGPVIARQYPNNNQTQARDEEFRRLQQAIEKQLHQLSFQALPPPPPPPPPPLKGENDNDVANNVEHDYLHHPSEAAAARPAANTSTNKAPKRMIIPTFSSLPRTKQQHLQLVDLDHEDDCDYNDRDPVAVLAFDNDGFPHTLRLPHLSRFGGGGGGFDDTTSVSVPSPDTSSVKVQDVLAVAATVTTAEDEDAEEEDEDEEDTARAVRSSSSNNDNNASNDPHRKRTTVMRVRPEDEETEDVSSTSSSFHNHHYYSSEQRRHDLSIQTIEYWRHIVFLRSNRSKNNNNNPNNRSNHLSLATAKACLQLGNAQLAAQDPVEAQRAFQAAYRIFAAAADRHQYSSSTITNKHRVSIALCMERMGLAAAAAASNLNDNGDPIHRQHLVRAYTVQLESFRLRHKLLGLYHVDTIASLNWIAKLHVQAHDLLEAQRCLWQVYWGRVAVFAPHHPSCAVAAHDIGNVFFRLQALGDAMNFYHIALQIYDGMDLPNENPAVAKLLRDMKRLERIEQSQGYNVL